MAYQWVDCDRQFISQRYDRIAGLIPIFDWLFFLPPGLRRMAVERLDLRAGDGVLEVGCGTGRNFPHLRHAVGANGQVFGVDLSAGMLAKARELRHRERWTNIELTECDAVNYAAPGPLDGVLFSLSYNTMPHHLAVLAQAWKQLRPGGRLVLMDSRVPPRFGGALFLPFGRWLMKHTLLGNPYIRPWEDLARLPGEFEIWEFLLGAYYICRVTKPEANVDPTQVPLEAFEGPEFAAA